MWYGVSCGVVCRVTVTHLDPWKGRLKQQQMALDRQMMIEHQDFKMLRSISEIMRKPGSEIMQNPTASAAEETLTRLKVDARLRDVQRIAERNVVRAEWWNACFLWKIYAFVTVGIPTPSRVFRCRHAEDSGTHPIARVGV